VACHGDRHSATFEKWKLGIELTMSDADSAYENARQMLEAAENVPDATRQQVTERLSAAQADLRLVKRGNGLHNVTYSMELLDSVTRRCQEAMALLEEAAKPPETGKPEEPPQP
jgi:hypothetical protein